VQLYQKQVLRSYESVQQVFVVGFGIDVKTSFLFWSRFFTFLTFFYFPNVFYLKNVGKVQSGKTNKKHFENNSNEIDL